MVPYDAGPLGYGKTPPSEWTTTTFHIGEFVIPIDAETQARYSEAKEALRSAGRHTALLAFCALFTVVGAFCLTAMSWWGVLGVAAFLCVGAFVRMWEGERRMKAILRGKRDAT